MPSKTKSHYPPICDYEDSSYQTTFWEEGGRAYEDKVEAIALRRLLPATGELLLEIGAGAGRNTPRYQGFKHIVVLDYSITQLRQAQERLGRSERYIYVAADAYHLPFVPALFEAATMIRVFHHIADGPKVLEQVHQVLRPDGNFILEFANKRNLKAILRYIFRRQSWNPFDLKPVEFVALNFNFHPETTHAWLQEVGFTVEEQLAVSHFRLSLFKRLVPLRILVKMDSLLQRTGNWVQLAPSVFVRSRVVGDIAIAAPSTPLIDSRQALFRCLACGHASWEPNKNHLKCKNCGTKWAIEDRIYNFKEPINRRSQRS